MRHKEPPRFAAWMLEHLASGPRDEALAGDLLEVFQSGRSNGWYWRQSLVACGVSWVESLRARASLLVFMLLWSMMAPPWNALCIKMESDHLLDRIISTFGPTWIFVALIGWTILHAIFLWGGILVFGAVHTTIGSSLRPERFKRAFVGAPLFFVPAYGAMFLLVGLNWYSYFESSQLVASPWGQILDLRILADVIRIPYIFALVCALWGAIPGSSRSAFAGRSESAEFAESGGLDAAGNSEVLALPSATDSFRVKRFFVLMVGAGVMNSMIAGFLLERLPAPHDPTFVSLCARALVYMLAGVVAGAGGTYLYWNNPASPFCAGGPLPFPLFALLCAGAWMWIPAMVILLGQISPASAFIATIGAFVLTSSLRRVSSAVFAPAPRCVAAVGSDNAQLFVESLYPSPVEGYGYVIAICLYAAGLALFSRSYFTAAALLALAASVFAWKRTIPPDQDIDSGQEYRRAGLRLALLIIPALLVTVWAVANDVSHRKLLTEEDAGATSNGGTDIGRNAAARSKAQGTGSGLSGYESVILWPFQEKKQFVAPPTAADTFLRAGSRQPLVIQFNGPYWYFQSPETQPGAAAHQAHGTPIGFDIKSENSIPVLMDAHQYLSAPIPVARFGEITVEIENRDNREGLVSLGVLLSDGMSAKRPAIYLGEQAIESTRPDHFVVKTTPVFETLRFSIPENAKIRKFNQITVLVLPDVEHVFDAPKIAIQQFRLYGR